MNVQFPRLHCAAVQWCQCDLFPAHVDINECEERALCGLNAACNNTPGSYSCVCNAGFVLKSGKLSISGNQEQCEGKGLTMLLNTSYF